METVNNYITLQRKSNSEKRVAIYYYKGPGQNALTAGGMEVVPSLYNLLQRMKREGYKVDAYLITYVDGVETGREKVSSDTYPAKADTVYVGVTPREEM